MTSGRRGGWRRIIPVTMLVLAALTGSAEGQDPAAGDPESERLRQTIEERFEQALRQQLDLTDEQAQKLRVTTRDFAQRRMALFREERDLRQAMDGQMRPGIAADQDSVARLTDRMARVRGDLARSYQDEIGALEFLTPVQRARYLQMRERLLERVREARARRQAERGFAPAERPLRGMREPRAGARPRRF